MMYEELIKALRKQASKNAELLDLLMKAIDAIEDLLKATKSMHTWIFLHSVDEQDAYDECGLTDEMNVALGYCGQIVAEPQKEEN